ncbi:hypothetical protein ROLI_014210 [Roseobacter fucihabitans]|uniref:DUF7146 domain-containing protein n=1 Tax=Roseobacter fucihabitans TaxID=1537242 RepID=A0ABZ2BSP6_9RHOB|nr:hypothetical protein [Roseobacter litoralis]
MTKQQKITLSASRDIPFNKLLLSQSNVRHIKAGVSIEELAEDIARRTLLASLTVRPVLDENGSETGMFEIPAGGRRFKGTLSGKGAAGKWTDAATGEHGDLLDIIRETCGFVDFADIAQEARRFLSLPLPERPSDMASRSNPAPSGSPKAARRLFAMSQPIVGTLAATYLRNRGLAALSNTASLRFHPRCYYRPDRHSETETWPALIASVTDLDGAIAGAHRTWLDPKGFSDATHNQTERAVGNHPRDFCDSSFFPACL